MSNGREGRADRGGAVMRFGTVCSGIGAPEAAWTALGWTPAFMSEIALFPRAVLAHRFPGVPLHGDFTTIKAGDYADIDVLCGGTPCQSFSIAGLRGGMDDERGNLALEYLRLADRLRPFWILWENVPGVLSSNGGRDFGAFIGALGELGYGWAYRSLDAQYFGLAQRRERVFVVGCLGDWRRSAAVLFKPSCLRGHPSPRQKAGQSVAGTLGVRTGRSVGAQDAGCGHMIAADVAPCLTGNPYADNKGREGELIAKCLTAKSGFRSDAETETETETETFVAHTLRGQGFDASEDGTGRGTPLVPMTFDWQKGNDANNPRPSTMNVEMDRSQTLGSTRVPAVAFQSNQSFLSGNNDDIAPTIRHEGSGGSGMPAVSLQSGVRRLTPKECERLQGFPDDWTDVPHRGKRAADGPRYAAIGNSMAVPVIRWIGERIAAVHAAAAA